MAFKVYGTLDGTAQISYVDRLKMTDAEAGTAGEMCVMSSGRLTKAGVSVKPQYLLLKTTAAGTGVVTDVQPVRNNVLYTADLVGAVGSYAVGSKYQIDSTGLKLDTVTTNAIFEVVYIDTAKSKAVVKLAV